LKETDTLQLHVNENVGQAEIAGLQIISSFLTVCLVFCSEFPDEAFRHDSFGTDYTHTSD
jgi:hypothetical protein